MTDPAIAHLTLAALSRAMEIGEISAEDATRTAIAGLEQLGPVLNCTVSVDADFALDQARKADAARARGKVRGPLHGVPLAHKDMYYRAGRPSACGSRALADFVPDVTATAIRRLDAAGAIDVGRLNMVEIALGVTGHNEITGAVRNPWNTDHIPGGSSSGSGAAVAARLAYGSLGSDTGGSIRFPAACCGITGIKPTYGRVSRAGAMPLSPSLDCPGPLARTAEDCALLLGAIAGHDPADPYTSTRPVPDYAAALERSVRGRVIAVPANHFRDPVTDAVQALLDASLDVLRDAGAEVIEVTVPDSVQIANQLNNLILTTEGAGLHGRAMREHPGAFDRQTLGRLATGALCPAGVYLDALNLRRVVLEEFAAAVFDKADALHLPIMPWPVPTIAETDLAANPGFNRFLVDMGHCTRPVNFMGLPSCAVPCGFTANGLPAAFQLVGRPFDEALLLNLAHAYQKETDWTECRPPVCA